MVRRKLVLTLTFAVLASVVTAAPASAQEIPEEPELTFVGGGWGHGIGMSQYGAYGRAEAGHLYDEILAHYYDDTTLGPVTDFPGFADPAVDVLIDVRSMVAVSTPLDEISNWEVRIEVDGVEIATANRPVTATYNGTRWRIDVRDGSGGTTDLCAANPLCEGIAIDIRQTVGEKFVLEEFEDGPNVGHGAPPYVGYYAHGSVRLHPAGLSTANGVPTRCGSSEAGQFCVVHADLDFQEYLYGLAEVPSSWPLESLKAQAVAGRSYAAATMRDRAGWAEPFDLYATTKDQFYAGWSKEATCATYAWCAAVDATADEVVIHDGSIATTFYSSSNGGYSAAPPDVWDGGSALPYLLARPDPFDDNAANPNGSWEHHYSLADVSRWLNAYADPDEGDQLHVGTVERIVIDNVPDSGRINYANVTIYGSKKTTEVLRNGRPYGYRFFFALRKGCLADDLMPDRSCDALLGTKFVIVSFSDVDFDAYFYSPIQWMTTKALTTGLRPNVFGPDEPNSRAQIATFIWRFAGEPEPAKPTGFVDVPEGSWFETAVGWLAEAAITTGTSKTEFSPYATVTRAQAATLLWRFAGSPTPTVDTGFDDVADDRYYTDPVRWMVQWGITTGTSPTRFSPDDALTRGQIATFLWRLAGVSGAFADGVELPDAMRVT